MLIPYCKPLESVTCGRRVVVNPLGGLHADLLELSRWPDDIAFRQRHDEVVALLVSLPCLYKHLVFKVFGAVIADRVSCTRFRNRTPRY
jgi:hypothetical protein